MTHSKRQHYVPRFLLKNFINEKDQKLFVYDLQEMKSFKTGPNNIAVEKGFYDIEVGDEIFTIEDDLSVLESKSANIINLIIENQSIKNLSDKQKFVLSKFIAIQYLRTYHIQNTMNEHNKDIIDFIKSLGHDISEIENFTKINREETKIMAIKMILNSSDKFAKLIYNKEWILTKVKGDKDFFISDHPVTLNNQLDFSPLGNIGFAVKGIEIHMPISNNLSLLLICPSWAKEIKKSIKKINNMAMYGFLTKKFLRRSKPIIELNKSIKNKEVLISETENVKYKNHLQICYANRWVYSPNGDFSLVERAIGEDNI